MTKLENDVARICGPSRRGRPTKACSPLLKALRAACAEKPNHMLNKRNCRLKKKAGRPRIHAPGTRKPRTTIRKAIKPTTIRKAIKPTKPMSLKAILNGMGPPPARTSRVSSARASPMRYERCYDYKYTAADKAILKNPRGNKNTRNRVKAKCTSIRDSQGRSCKVSTTKGFCMKG